MKKNLLTIVILLIIVSILFTACANESSNSDVKAKDSIVIGIEEDAVSLDPQNCSDAFGFEIMTNIYDTLFRVDSKGDFYPCLVENWTKTDDGKGYTFDLKKNVKFHNGEELKASDVKFTIDRAIKSSYTADLYVCVDTVEITGDYQVKVNLKYPFDPFISILCQASSNIVNERAIKESSNYEKNPIGTGPYKFVEWVGGKRVVMTGVEDYHMGKPSIMNVEFRIIMDKSTAFIALEKGEIDAYVNIDSIDRQAVINNKKFDFYEIPSYFCFYLEFNNEIEPFNNKLVRQALSYAIDKEAIINNAKNGIGYISHNQVPEGIYGYTDSVKSYPHDIGKAKELLTQAGYANGFSFKLLATEGDYAKIAQVIKDNLAEVGVTADIEILEFGTFIDEMFGGKADAFLVEFGVYYPDADSVLYRGYHSDYFGPSGNFVRYSNKEVDALLEKAKVAIDKDDRLEMYKEILNILHEDAPNVPLFINTTNIACNANLQGVNPDPQLQNFVYEYSWK